MRKINHKRAKCSYSCSELIIVDGEDSKYFFNFSLTIAMYAILMNQSNPHKSCKTFMESISEVL